MIGRDLRAAMLLPSAFAFRGYPSFSVGGGLRDLPDIQIANRSPPHDASERVPRTDASADARALGAALTRRARQPTLRSNVNDISRLTRLLLPLIVPIGYMID